MYEEEKGQHPEAPQLDRSFRALSSRWSDEGSQEGSEQEGMPRKGACMRVGDLVKIKYNGVVTLVVEVEVCQTGENRPGAWYHLLNQPVSFRAENLEAINESR